MIRTKGEAGSGNIVEAVRHIRTIVKEMKQLTVMGKDELVHEAKDLQAPLELVEWVADNGKLPVPNFSAGGIATPGRRRAGHAAGRRGRLRRLRHLQIGRSRGARRRHRQGRQELSDPEKLLEASRALGDAMPGLDISKIPESELMQTRGW